MVTALVLIHTRVDRIEEVAQILTDIDGVSEVYSVAGDVDLVAMVRVPRHEQLADVIAGQINKTDGVLSTRTMIAFQAYSQHDLEAAFSLGS
jgi:DNA-binding Lrp family transcriptional regulator